MDGNTDKPASTRLELSNIIEDQDDDLRDDDEVNPEVRVEVRSADDPAILP